MVLGIGVERPLFFPAIVSAPADADGSPRLELFGTFVPRPTSFPSKCRLPRRKRLEAEVLPGPLGDRLGNAADFRGGQAPRELCVERQRDLLAPREPGGEGCALALELPDFAIGNAAQLLEHGDVPAHPLGRADGRVRAHVALEQRAFELVQRVRFFASPLDAPVRVQRVLRDKAGELPIGLEASCDTALYGSVEAQGLETGCGMRRNRRGHQIGRMGVA